MKAKKKNSNKELMAMLEASATDREFNIAADMRELQKQYRSLRVKDFKIYLQQIVDKYNDGEYAMVHEVLLKECRKGNVAAIRLYHEMRKNDGGSGTEVRIVDDI